MINRTPSPTRAVTKVEVNSNIQEVKSLSGEIDYFNSIQPLETVERFGYANQTEVDQGLPGYANKTKSSYANQDAIANDLTVGYENADSSQKSGYSNQDAITNDLTGGYENTDASNEAQSIASVANAPQSLQDLIISIKDKQTGDVKSSYKMCPLLLQEESALIEQQCGVVLKKDSANPDRFNGFLGGGAFGKVYVAREENTNPAKYVAIKIVQGNQKALVESKHESGLQLKLTQAVNSEDSQLMPIIGIGENLSRTQNEAEKLYIVMPLAGMGSGESLRKDLNELKKTNTSTEFYRLLNLHVAKSMLIGLHQMHRNHIYHLDLKPANMMITGDGRIQLSDFGTSEEVPGNPPSLKVGKDQQSGRFIGNGDSTYFPQERTFYEGSTFDPANADIYAAGAVLFEFLTGKEFDNYNSLNDPIFSNVAKGSLEELTLRLLNPQTSSRIRLEDALNHPCLAAVEVHDESINKVVLGFLGNYVKYSQSKARGDSKAIDQLAQSLKDDLDKSQLQAESLNASPNLVTNPNDPFTLNPIIKVPFSNRPDVKGQLQTYLPLKCSLGKIISDPEKQTFSLIDKANEFLANPNTALLLLLADGGAGKSLFVQWLVTNILEQKAPYDQIKAPNGKPYFPLYVTLSNIKNPHKIFEEGLNLTKESINELQQTHQVLLIMDGFDEQSYQWKNLYSENQLYNYPGLKVMVTSRINALPSIYSEYFVARQPDGKDLGYQELYLQPFQTDQIDTYVANYIAHHKDTIKEQIEQKQLPVKWLEAKYVQEQIKSIPGLKELMQTPLLCRLVLIALPQLSQKVNQNQGEITRAQVYEAFMRQWIITQMVTKQHKSLDQISDEEINQVLAFGQKMALEMYQDNRSTQLNVGIATFSFNSATGKYQENPSKYKWFQQGKDKIALLPLQESQAGSYKFVHLSMQEYLFASYLIDELTHKSLKNLTLNQVTLTLEEKDRPIIYFLGDMATMSNAIADKLFALIDQTKTDKTQSTAGANAISALNVSEVSLTGRNFSKTYLPNTDISGGMLFGTDFSNANLPNINLQGSNLNNTNFKEAKLNGLRLGQYPMYCLDGLIGVLCYSPNGRYLAISQVKELVLFELATRKEVTRFKGHTGWITSVSFSGDGKLIVTGSQDKTARIYDAMSGECKKVLVGHTKFINSVIFSPNDKLIATGSSDNTVQIYDVESGECSKVLKGHIGSIESISFSGDGKQITTVSKDKTVRVYDVESSNCQKMVTCDTKIVSSISFSPNRKLVAMGGSDQTSIHDVETGKLVKLLRGNTQDASISSISFSRDGKLVATGASDGTVQIFDVVSGECQKTLMSQTKVIGSNKGISSIIFSPDDKCVIVGVDDKTLRTFDVDSGESQKKFVGHTNAIQVVSFSPDGETLFTEEYDFNGRAWSVLTGKDLRDYRLSAPSPNPIGFTKHISLDNLSAKPNGNKVNLTQTIKTSATSEPKTETFSLSFPTRVDYLGFCKSKTGEVILTVVFSMGIVFYRKPLEAPLNEFSPFGASSVNQSLEASGMDLSNAEGLSESNYEVLKQLGAVGEVAKIAEPDQPSMPEIQAKDSQKMRGLQ